MKSRSRGRSRSRSKSRDNINGVIGAGRHNYDLADQRPLKKKGRKGTAADVVKYRSNNSKTMKTVSGGKGCSPLRSKSQKRIVEIQERNPSYRSQDSDEGRYRPNHSPLRSSLSKRRSVGQLHDQRSEKSVRFEDQRGILIYGETRRPEPYQPLRRDSSIDERSPPISQFERSDAMRKIRQHHENINKVQQFINSQGGILKNRHELEESREKEMRHPLRRSSYDGSAG